ncbi:hypothetical protein [Planococcus sp. NCCP-2050]|uniref:hypothetical protein n=1 Tax=Planococcus sp. NCCP-2050 TaxID=2944679 RepID=UPI00203CDDB7|nr:hypothetical protein [Planococcus sp. NCCP-2050]GKW45858.1 hypothetical protein NCCP2050_15500 [Planococcus sp. NCCP-2050]
MKFYWLAVLLFYIAWFLFSTANFSEVVWWSIFSSNRATHTPYIEQVSVVKIAATALIFGGLHVLIHRSKPAK